MNIDRNDAEYIMTQHAALDAGTLVANHYCPECDLEFDSMHDARLRADHIVIPFPGEGNYRWSGEFAVIIACEGYHIMNEQGKIKTID